MSGPKRHVERAPARPEIRVRPASVEDGAAIWRLVQDTGVLDVNSPYSYLLTLEHLGTSSLVAEVGSESGSDAEVVGFVTALRPPQKSEVVFVWQIGVDASMRGRGLASLLLDKLARREIPRGATHLETNITPSNGASQALFRSFARRFGATCETAPGFGAELFPDETEHEREELYRIGPLHEPAADATHERSHPKNGSATNDAEDTDMSLETFERLESEVRSYCRSFPTVFQKAQGEVLIDADGGHYIDFFAGAGALNYGHNEPHLKAALVDYLAGDGIIHGLDMATSAKEEFLETFASHVLEPRELSYKIQFPGPTGTNAVEAALKLARKVTGRQTIVSFTNAFHGMTLGSLAVTGNGAKRAGAGVPLQNAMALPYDGYLGDGIDTLDQLETMLEDRGSGLDLPAAVILETVQAEGGVNIASFEWLQRLDALTKRYGVLLIIDDIQVGCGRTGPFFSFEPAGITPDIVCLSKSISGFGLPMAVVLLKPEHDVWNPGEHNGTFRGHNLAFRSATEALRRYWGDDELSRKVERHGQKVRQRLEALVGDRPEIAGQVRGRGLIQGLELEDKELAGEIAREAFKRGLVIETAGLDDQVLKVLPPLTIREEKLDAGLDIVEESLNAVLSRRPSQPDDLRARKVA